MVLKEWLINLTPSNMYSTSSLAMAKFSLGISWELFKYPCSSKDNLYNNNGSLCYHKGNLCCKRVLCATTRENDLALRSTATIARSTLVTLAANCVAADAICSEHFSTHVLARPTSVAPGKKFATARSTLATTKLTRAATTLVYISTRSTLAGAGSK